MNLASFLHEYPADTDLTVKEWRSESELSVACLLITSPWWVSESDRGPDNGQLLITCSGVIESEIRLGWRASEVEDVAVVSNDPRLWAHGQHGAIFGNAPLPDPNQFFFDFVDLVETQFLTSQNATSYLGVSFGEWKKRVTTYPSYQLIEGPGPLLDNCRSLLDKQGADYRLLLGPPPSRPAPILVWIGESSVICEDAEVALSPSSAL